MLGREIEPVVSGDDDPDELQALARTESPSTATTDTVMPSLTRLIFFVSGALCDLVCFKASLPC